VQRHERAAEGQAEPVPFRLPVRLVDLAELLEHRLSSSGAIPIPVSVSEIGGAIKD